MGGRQSRHRGGCLGSASTSPPPWASGGRTGRSCASHGPLPRARRPDAQAPPERRVPASASLARRSQAHRRRALLCRCWRRPLILGSADPRQRQRLMMGQLLCPQPSRNHQSLRVTPRSKQGQQAGRSSRLPSPWHWRPEAGDQVAYRISHWHAKARGADGRRDPRGCPSRDDPQDAERRASAFRPVLIDGKVRPFVPRPWPLRLGQPPLGAQQPAAGGL